jgi:hypothetical protein
MKMMQVEIESKPIAQARAWRRHDLQTDISGACAPSPLVHELAQQLDGRLRAVGLARRHVEVIHKHQRAPTYWWAVHALATLVQATVHLEEVNKPEPASLDCIHGTNRPRHLKAV